MKLQSVITRHRKNALKILGTFADPLGLICPLVLQVKLLFKEACILDGKWDNLLPTEFVVKCNNLIKELWELLFISVPRYKIPRYRFSVAVYAWSSKNDDIVTKLLTVKSKIVPNRKLAVPKLEIMSCLLLLRLIVSVRKALSVQVIISNVISRSDSEVALCWLRLWQKSRKFGLRIVCPRLDKM